MSATTPTTVHRIRRGWSIGSSAMTCSRLPSAILSPPGALRELLAHDHDRCRPGTIAVIEQPSRHQPRLHRLKIGRRDRLGIDVGVPGRAIRRVPFDVVR